MSQVAERSFGPLFESLGTQRGTGHHEDFSKNFPHRAGISVIADDLPEVYNTVELNKDKTDSFGMPAVKATYPYRRSPKKCWYTALKDQKRFCMPPEQRK